MHIVERYGARRKISKQLEANAKLPKRKSESFHEDSWSGLDTRKNRSSGFGGRASTFLNKRN